MSTSPQFYLLHLSRVPDSLFKVNARLDDWYKLMEHSGSEGFPANSLSQFHSPCSVLEQVCLCVMFTLYFFLNYMPIVLVVSAFFLPLWIVFGGMIVLVFIGILIPNANILFRWVRSHQPQDPITITQTNSDTIQKFQLERNVDFSKVMSCYFGTKLIFPSSLIAQASVNLNRPVIICIVPHGVIPLGSGSYMSKLFGNFPTVFAGAPILWKIPPLRAIMSRTGAFPAGKKGIHESLAAGRNVCIVLDGIAGMFCSGTSDQEQLWLLKRKAICAIALQYGCSIVPGYCFGTNEMFTVLRDPWGLMKWASIQMDISLTPFLGRFSLPMGPPRRKPLVMAFGDPVVCSQMTKNNAGYKTSVNTKHRELLDGFKNIFDTHKTAYGWQNRKLTFV